MSEFAPFLADYQYINYSHPAIQTLVQQVQGNSEREKAMDLYYRIRDGIRYNPYTFMEGESALYASYAATNDDAYCIPKSALMVAGCRALGIPARLGLADVRNHLSSHKLLDALKTDLFVMHGYADLYLDGKWVKCTPVFNQALCDKFGVKTLEFDGMHDSIFHPYTEDGRPHMEYVRDHGTFCDVPVQKILQACAEAYPHVDLSMGMHQASSLEADLADS